MQCMTVAGAVTGAPSGKGAPEHAGRLRQRRVAAVRRPCPATPRAGRIAPG
ncbi:hypothetical protein SBD_4851 [Streptomyces bottropensis ATCC 25435]|uniref:Uncharacterized protein n=1 Tax=Streptomyces bottropensis ATCC 25435 TaxID=1054862 RepID=M3DAF8_9ACTN|nr:hypothetical protein SBD_4851 [Streptomyces bottropensis ATCC 25435]